MATDNHTAISTGAAANASTINTPLGTLDAAIGNIAPWDGVSVAAIITTAIDTDGTLKAGTVDGTTILADGIITAAKMVDSTITDAKIGDNAIQSINLVHDPYNAVYAPSTTTQDGAVRWYNAGNLSQVTPDASNPYGLPTIRTVSATGGGKRIYLAEAGLKVGDTVSVAVEALMLAGTTGRVIMQFLTSGGSGVSSSFTAISAGASVSITRVSAQVIPATTASIAIIVRRDSGSGNVDAYAWHLIRGSRVRTTMMVRDTIAERGAALLGAAAGTLADLDTRLSVSLNTNGTLKTRGLVPAGGYDPLFRAMSAPNTGGSSTKEDNLARWLGETGLTLLYDTSNPFVTKTLRLNPAASTTGGIKIHLSDSGLVIGDIFSVAILAKWPGTTSARIVVAFRDSGGSSLSTSAGGYNAGTAAITWISNSNLTIPASTSWIEVYLQVNSGTDSVDMYGIWLTYGSSIAQDDAEAYGYGARYDVADMARRADGQPALINPGGLTSWLAALSNMEEGTASATARLAIVGDSITNDTIRGIRQLCTRLWADWANGGIGWISADSAQYLANSRWNFQSKFTSTTRSGTWTERYPATGARGPDCTEVESTANGDIYTHVVTCTDAVIHYLAYNGGPEFRWRVDSGAWTTVDTDNGAADAWAKVDISGLSAAGTVSIQTEALAAGVVLFGWEFYDNSVTNGVVINKMGHPGAKTSEWADMVVLDTCIDGIANIAPDAVLIALGTNENQSAVSYLSFVADMEIIIDAIQTALPNADVGLIGPYITDPSVSANRFETTRRWIRETAVRRGLFYLDLSNYLGTVAHRTALGMVDDAIHINAIGGAVVGKAYYDALKF